MILYSGGNKNMRFFKYSYTNKYKRIREWFHFADNLLLSAELDT